MQEERLEREAEGKRMLLEDQRAANGYNSHRNYQNLSARSPDTMEEVRHAAEPSFAQLWTFVCIVFCPVSLRYDTQSRRMSLPPANSLKPHCRNLELWML